MICVAEKSIAKHVVACCIEKRTNIIWNKSAKSETLFDISIFLLYATHFCADKWH